MRSRRGFLAAMVLLLAVPLTVAYQVVLGDDGGLVVHLALATGAFLIAASVFDYEVSPWLTWITCVSMIALGSIFLLQAATAVIPSEALRYLAYDVLGQWLELALTFVFLVWVGALLLTDSRGGFRVFGVAALAAVVLFELYRLVLSRFGVPAEQGLRLVYLLPVVWFLLESRKPSTLGVAA
jgi:hypothetical protein